MIGTKERKNQKGETTVPVKNRNSDSKFSHNSCGGCNACHQMTRIRSVTGSPTWDGSGGSSQKPCATNFFQRNLGNSYIQSIAAGRQTSGGVPTIQRKCSCGGSCVSCEGKEDEELRIQPKLTISSVNDVYEQEADRVAHMVMRIRDSSLQGEHDHLTAGINIQRISDGDSGGLEPGLDIQLDPIGGQPLSASTRKFMEPRFGTDFSHVRVHTDNEAHQTASQIRARAFTYGSNIWLGEGERGTDKNLMAHELTHVVQQSREMSNSPKIQRTVVVNPNTTAADDILHQLRDLCPYERFDRSGRTIVGYASSNVTQSCACVTDAVGDPHRTYTINVDSVSNTPRTVTLHNGTSRTIPSPSSGPRTYTGANPVIHMPLSTGSAIEFGAFSPTGAAMWVPNWRILGHELCGHARLNQSYPGTKGNRPGHNTTINTENIIAAEHGHPPRGVFTDTRQGESFHNLSGNQSQIAFMLVNGWHYEAP